MKRRDFLKHTLPAIALPAILDGWSLNAFAQSPLMQGVSAADDNGRVLVLVQLNGGNDGLNTVIPIDLYDAYHAARTNIAIPQEKILRLNGFDQTGLNPAMTHIQQLFNEGKVSIVQAVSYPNPNFSHFRATDIWLTGSDSDKTLDSGWAGRFLNNEFPGFPAGYPNNNMTDPLAIQVGGIVSPALQGPVTNMGMAITNPSSFYALLNNVNTSSPVSSRAGDQLAYIREMTTVTDKYATIIKNAAQKIKTQSSLYPAQGKNPLADQLKIVARLIAGGLKTKVYMVNMGGFDTHARQTDTKDTSIGAHAKLLERLSEAVNVFMVDLQELGVADRVLGMTFSEFGRRVKSNASGGTDHGAAAPVFLFGNSVQPGIIGTNPAITAAATPKDNIAMQHDFRSLYTTILKNWFMIDQSASQSVMLKDFASLAFIKGMNTSAT
ncbi:MAG: DUF1501 domain-containing protein [Chitinophagaceae bacterium]